LHGVFAANISLGNPGIEFGQGITAATACSGATSISITPVSSFINAASSGTHKLSGFKVSNVPSGCQDDVLRISAYGESSSARLSLYDTDQKTVAVRYQAGAFSIEENATGMIISNDSSGAFTVTFGSPVTATNDFKKITIESSNVSQRYPLGTTGPGGGIVFYYSSGGFISNGVTMHYLEASVKTWQAAGYDTALLWAVAAKDTTAVTGLSESIGAGYANSEAIVNQGNDVTTAAGKARAYTGGGKSDWYLPSYYEFNELCKFAKNEPSLSPTTLCSNGGTLNAGISNVSYQLQVDAYWLSSEYSATAGQYFYTTTAFKGYNPKSYPYKVRAIRAF
jgi:hypothetical protein